jgi:hydroxypyruvate reductase
MLEIFSAAIKRVNGDEAVYQHLYKNPIQGPVYVIAIGKAAQSMAEGAVRALGRRIKAGLIISKYGHTAPIDGFEIIESAHPVPDQNCLKAGERLMSFIKAMATGAEVLVLISGGTSALVDVLEEGVSLETLESINQQLLQNGKTIEEINSVRKQFSRIKGGKLAAFLKQQKVTQLLISDVPGDNLHVIGSGLLICPQAHERQQAQVLCDEMGIALPQPAHIAEPSDFKHIESHMVANNRDALIAAADKAQQLGYEAVLDNGLLDGDTYQCSQHCIQQMSAGMPGLYLWGGETVLVLPENPGRGGRNQAFALQAAVAIDADENLYLLAAGTDGTDGPTGDAGALVDYQSVSRMQAQNVRPEECLAKADSGNCLELSGDLIHTGPTGTNVMDIVIGIKAQ